MIASPASGLGAFATAAPAAYWACVAALAICAALIAGAGARRVTTVAVVFCAALVVAAPTWGVAVDLIVAAGLIAVARRSRSRALGRLEARREPPPAALLLGRVARVRCADPARAQVGLDGRRWLARFEGPPAPLDAPVRVLRIATDGRLVVLAVA